MNEADVAARVAQNIPKEPVAVQEPATLTNVAPQPTDEGYIFQNPLDELSMYKLYDYFGVDLRERTNSETHKVMDKLVEWATMSGAVEYHDVIGKVREIQRLLGKNDLHTLYSFAKIDMQRQRLEKEMSKLYGA